MPAKRAGTAGASQGYAKPTVHQPGKPASEWLGRGRDLHDERQATLLELAMDSVRLQVLAGLVAQGGRHVDVGEGAEAPGGERLLDPGGGGGYQPRMLPASHPGRGRVADA